ncbi:hypothetical protein [Spirosoma pulveris]
MQDLNRAVKLNPNDALLYYNRGLCRQQINYMNSALSDFHKALTLAQTMLPY